MPDGVAMDDHGRQHGEAPCSVGRKCPFGKASRLDFTRASGTEGRNCGNSLSVHLHPEQALQNRFILTEGGGASYQTGLDDNEEGRSADDDLVTLLEPATFECEWMAYPSSKHPFLCYPPGN